MQLLDKQDGTHSLKITPAQSGRHILHVLYGGEHVLGKRLHPHRKENIIIISYMPMKKMFIYSFQVVFKVFLWYVFRKSLRN